MADETPRAGGTRRTLRTLGWAAFLGVSWTWCIGMFLPVLLVRDYGLWAWVLFAIPNVIGAAAVGWIVRETDASHRMVDKHQLAIVAFSFVTIGFHVFWLVCVVAPIVQSWFILPIAMLAMLLAWLLAHHVRGGWLMAAAGTLIVSIASFATLGATRALALPAQQGQLPTLGLLWLVPVTIVGFALCPYLDITFHRARQSLAPAEARLAFGLGFGACFLAMIVLTLLYAPLIMTRFGSRSLPPASLAVWLIAVHMAVQAGFTIAAHVRYGGRRLGGMSMEQSTVLILLTLGVLMAAMIVVSRDATYRGLSGAELSYRFFMAFYGLVFPAYVWICMVPTPLTEPRVPPRALTIFAVATLMAAPMFWMGFIERRTFWLVPGVAVVLLSQLVVRMTAPRVNQVTLATLPRSVGPDDAMKDFLTASK